MNNLCDDENSVMSQTTASALPYSMPGSAPEKTRASLVQRRIKNK